YLDRAPQSVAEQRTDPGPGRRPGQVVGELAQSIGGKQRDDRDADPHRQPRARPSAPIYHSLRHRMNVAIEAAKVSANATSKKRGRYTRVSCWRPAGRASARSVPSVTNDALPVSILQPG